MYHSEATSTHGGASEATTTEATEVAHKSEGVVEVVVVEAATGVDSSSSLAASWSSLECPLSLEVSLSLSESSDEGEWPPPPPSPFLSSSSSDFLESVVVVVEVRLLAAAAAAMLCWTKEKMDTRLVI